MSFKDLIESKLKTQLSSALSEGKLKAGKGKVTIDMDHTGDGIPAASKEFRIKFKKKAYGYDLSGEKKDILAYLQSKDYDMDPEDIEDLFPELLDEAMGDVKTFKTLEDWLMAVLDIKGATVSKMGNTLRANGLGRTQSATFELKKGRGSLLESAELEDLEEAGKLHHMILDVIKKMSPKDQKLAIAGLPKDMQQQALDYIKEAKEECPKCEGAGCNHCDDTGYHVTEGLDKVNKKALAKDFDDRKDKDIDNDGDVDDSDEYLHKRRGAIKKAIGKSKEKRESKKQFMYAAKTAKEDGEKEFVFAGKTYKCEDVEGI